jgi:hypothetical protein
MRSSKNCERRNYMKPNWVAGAPNKTHGGANMKLKSSMLSLPGLALLGSLGIGIGSASAQSIYLETYAEPYPIVEPYPVVVAPRYVVRPAIVAPAPLVRQRTIVVSRPGYVSAPLLGPPMPPPYMVADW